MGGVNEAGVAVSIGAVRKASLLVLSRATLSNLLMRCAPHHRRSRKLARGLLAPRSCAGKSSRVGRVCPQLELCGAHPTDRSCSAGSLVVIKKVDVKGMKADERRIAQREGASERMERLPPPNSTP